MEEKKEVVVVNSGYFDPIHIGHIEMLKLSKKLGDKLIVIVNNDHQAVLKKGKPFMNQEERLAIVKEIKCVDDVFLSIDEDRTVCKSIEAVNPDIFANGGDRGNHEIPEKEICDKIGCKIIDGIGEKIQSSSTLIANSSK